MSQTKEKAKTSKATKRSDNKKKRQTKKNIPRVTTDDYFKTSMHNLRLARDFLTFNLPENIKSHLLLDTLDLAPQEYLTAAMRKRSGDVVYTVQLKDTDDELGYIVLLVEQQTRPKRKMPLRMLEFMLTTMRQISDNHKKEDNAPVPVVLPLILSNHTGKYPKVL